MNTPQTLKGFRDFLPEEKRRRDYILNKMKPVFELYGFEPVETPTLEYADIIMGKYGAEADKLVYRFTDNGGRDVALPYDQTVPTARVLIQYQGQLPRFFRRYAIRNVFRADKPQKGRYREFTQCDIDIFGSTSTLSDAEILACTYSAFKAVGFPTINIKVNDRQTLINTLTPFAIETVSVFSLIQSLDKLDKMPPEAVLAELSSKGLTPENAQAALNAINSAPVSNNLKQILDAAKSLGIPENSLQYSPTLARGLDYYTGMIFEIVIPEYPVGSFGGGGRYDKLIQNLGGPDVPAVGMAFGFDRIVEGADSLNLIPKDNIGTEVLVTIFDENLVTNALNIAGKLRSENIKTEVYPSVDKLDKQLKLANLKQIKFVIIIGSNEATNNQVTLKNMSTGEQQTLSIDEVISKIKNLQ
jgi:histidyl-tRNA synthetase